MEDSTFFLSQNAPTRSHSTRFRSVFVGTCYTWILALALFFSHPSHASHRNRPYAATAQPSFEASTAVAAKGALVPGEGWILVLLLLALIAILLWRDRAKAAGYRAQILIFEEKIQKFELNAVRLDGEKSRLTKEIATLRAFAEARVTEISRAKTELKELETRLQLVLDANPGAEDRVRAKARRDAETRAIEEGEREKRRLTEQGGAQVQALLTELKRGW